MSGGLYRTQGPLLAMLRPMKIIRDTRIRRYTKGHSQGPLGHLGPLGPGLGPGLGPLGPMDAYISRSWLRQHLYYLGFDLIRLQTYQKLSQSIGTTAGGFIKSLVSDISTFINTELTGTSGTRAGPGASTSRAGTSTSSGSAQDELKQLMYLYNNDLIQDLSDSRLSECRLFFMLVGYMLLHTHDKLDEFTDKLVSIYLKFNNTSVSKNDEYDKTILSLMNSYYSAGLTINYHKLYDSSPKKLSLFVTNHIKIDLPPLPRIKNHGLLTKALLHKELYRGLIHKDHPVYDLLVSNGISVDRDVGKLIRNDLSFFDGLGDFYLSKESSNLLYKFKNLDPYINETSFGRKSYTLLKTILATNTLLSRLALTYKLHEGLDDPIVNEMFRDSYVPYLNEWKDLDFETCQESKNFKYEQEFVADYFEQYVGTLFVEQPQVAQNWISQIYRNILFLIGDEHKMPSKAVQYDYNSWGVDIIGRKLR